MENRVRDVMTEGVSMLSPDQSVSEAAEMMRKDDIGILPVGEDDRLVGMLSDRDIVTRGLAKGLDPGSTKVRDVMSEKVLYCFDDEECEEAASNMGDNQVRRLPVVNRDKRLVGMVSLGDLAHGGQGAAAGEALEDIAKPGHGKAA